MASTAASQQIQNAAHSVRAGDDVLLLAATVIATAVARYIDGYSIYSARLPPQRGGPPRRPGAVSGIASSAGTDGPDTA